MPADHTRGRFRDRSLMMNPAPVIGAALAVFALAFGGLTLRLASGHDPALAPSAIVQRSTGGQSTALTTRASGAAAGSPASAAPSAGHPATIVTAASGSRSNAAGAIAGSDA